GGAENRLEKNPYTRGLPDEVAKRHAELYGKAFAMFLRHKDVVGRVTFWGTHDGRSWLNHFPVRGRTDHPLLFDRQGKPKAAFFAVTRAARDASVAPRNGPKPIKILFLGDNGFHRPMERFRQLQPVMTRRRIDLRYTDKVDALNPKTLANYDGLLIYA